MGTVKVWFQDWGLGLRGLRRSFLFMISQGFNVLRIRRVLPLKPPLSSSESSAFSSNRPKP